MSQLQRPVNIIKELKIHVKNEKSLDHVMYRIRPNYRTACLVFFKITGKTCGKIWLPNKDTLKKGYP